MIRSGLLILLLSLGAAFAAPYTIAGSASIEKNMEYTGGLPAASLLIGDNDVLKFRDPAGKLLWSKKVGGTIHDLAILPNDNILYANGEAVREIDGHTRQVIREYIPEEKAGGGVFSCQRLPNGQTVIGENSTGRVIELDSAFKIVSTVKLLNYQKGSHQNIRLVRKTPEGNYLVCHSGKNTVREYAPDGKVVLTLKTPALAFQAERLPNGNTLISSLSQIAEYTPVGKVVWKVTDHDFPDVTLRNMTGFQILPNGNLLVGCYAAYDKKDGSAFFEVTREPKIVWRYSHPDIEKSVMAVRMMPISISSLQEHQPKVKQ